MGKYPIICRPLLLAAMLAVALLCLLLSVSLLASVIITAVIFSICTAAFVFVILKRKSGLFAFFLAFVALFSVYTVIYRYVYEAPAMKFLNEYERTGNELSYKAEITEATFGTNYAVYTLRLTEPLKIKAQMTVFGAEFCEKGEYIEGYATVERPEKLTSRNFEEEKMLRADGIFVKLTSSGLPMPFGKRGKGLAERLSSHAERELLRYVGRSPSMDGYALAKGLLLGDKSSIPQSITDGFRRCGISHILSISGLHMSILLCMVNLLLTWMKCPKVLRVILLLAFSLLYMAVAGFCLSVVRAGIMACILNVGGLFGKRADPLTSLSAAAIFLCILSPYSVYDVGAALSFLATAGILCCAPLFSIISQGKSGISMKIAKYIGTGFLTTSAAVSFTLPFSLATFGELSGVGFAVNFLTAIPVTVMLLFAFVISALSYLPFGFCKTLCTLLGLSVNAIVAYIERVADFFAGLRFSCVDTPNSLIPLVISATVIVIILLLAVFVRNSYFTVPAICSVVMYPVFAAIFTVQSVFAFGMPSAFVAYDSDGAYLSLRENGEYLCISGGDRFTGHTRKTIDICDEYSGKNTYLVTLHGDFSAATEIESITNFNRMYGIEKTVFPLEGGEEYKRAENFAVLSGIPVSYYNHTEAFTFGNFEMSFSQTSDSFTVLADFKEKPFLAFCAEDRFGRESVANVPDGIPLYIYASKKKIPEGDGVPKRTGDTYIMNFEPEDGIGIPIEKNVTSQILPE